MRNFTPVLLLLCFVGSFSFAGSDLEFASPEEVGISSERLETMHQFIEDSVENYPLTGAITLIARHGKIVDFKSVGYRDKLQGLKMEKDSIFRLYSMTKTLASAGAMVLVEQGKIQLNDPVGKHLPEFANPQVFISRGVNGPTSRQSSSTMLVKHLLTHTAGFARGRGGNPDLEKLYQDSGVNQAKSLEEYVEKLGQLPLQDDPGTNWVYGPSISVLGALIQRVSGQSFESFLKEHIFHPLGMEDTFFVVPQDKRDRLVSVFNRADGKLVYVVKPEENGDMIAGYPSGGGGLYGTITDYFKFAQMLLNKGTYNGVSVLGKKTVESMMQNQTGFLGTGSKSNNRSEAYGYGGSVKIDTFYEKDMSSVGSFGWGGAATTWYRIDPQEEFIAMFFTQQFPMAGSLVPPFANTSWQAIIE